MKLFTRRGFVQQNHLLQKLLKFFLQSADRASRLINSDGLFDGRGSLNAAAVDVTAATGSSTN